ncbi:MAG: hypothetical protein AAF224_00695 [Pseudomonadota bacterium]
MADGAAFSKTRRPRIAFTGEEFGFGYQAVSGFAGRYANLGDRRLSDGGFSAINDKIDNSGFDLTKPERQPLYTKEQALVAVRNKTADLAVVPFYAPHTGYDLETLTTLSSLLTLLAVEQVDATDRLCLAVYEPQMLDLVQSAHPGSGLSTLLKDKRSRWHSNDSRRFADPFTPGGEQGQQFTAGLQLDASTQYMLRERIDMVFAGPEAARRCKTKLDALRGAGLEIRETLNSVEPHREMARLARGTLNNSRQTNTFFDPRDGKTHVVSSMSADNPNSKLYGVVMPFEIASRSSDFVIIDDDVEDANPDDPALKTRFFVVRNVPDVTIMDDRLALTEERAGHWTKRLKAVLDDNKSNGVRVMLRFNRAGAAAATSDVEEILRSSGVRYSMVKIGEDSGKDTPAPVVLDIEFDEAHFDGSFLSPSVVKTALKNAFARWKKRQVTVIAAMPFDEPQLAETRARRLLSDGVGGYLAGMIEAIAVRHGVTLGLLLGAGLGILGYQSRAAIATALAPIARLFGL